MTTLCLYQRSLAMKNVGVILCALLSFKCNRIDKDQNVSYTGEKKVMCNILLFPFLNKFQNEINENDYAHKFSMHFWWFDLRKEVRRREYPSYTKEQSYKCSTVSIQYSLESRKSPDTDIFILEKWLTLFMPWKCC